MSSVIFSMIFATFATVEKEGRFSFWPDSF